MMAIKNSPSALYNDYNWRVENENGNQTQQQLPSLHINHKMNYAPSIVTSVMETNDAALYTTWAPSERSFETNWNNQYYNVNYPSMMQIPAFRKIEIEIPLSHLGYETIVLPQCCKVVFNVYPRSTLNDLIIFIKQHIVMKTFGNKEFGNCDKFRIGSKRCVFYKISKSEDARKRPLMELIELNKIPHILFWNSNNSHDDCYKFTLGIKKQFCVNFFNDASNDKIASILAASQRLNIKVIALEMIDARMNNSRKKIFEHDKLDAGMNICDNDKSYVELWKQYGLDGMGEDDLCTLLYNEWKQSMIDKKIWIDDSKFASTVTQFNQEIEKKMKHMRHVQMACPLNKAHILSILMYCNLEMFEPLTKSQIGKEKDLSKYIVLDYCLFWAITRLDQFNSNNNRNMIVNNKKAMLFCGMHGISFSSQSCKINKMIEFSTHTSFTLDIETAKKFCMHGSRNNGFILCLNDLKHVVCCDVSWISKFKEYEILVRRHCGAKYQGYADAQTDACKFVCLGDHYNQYNV